MQSLLLRVGAVFMALAVVFGAFGAHALRERLTPGDLEIWKTGVLYQLVHALALLIVGAAWAQLDPQRAALSGWLLMGGVLIFSGSLYVLVLSNVRVLGAITPIGGVLMIAGWIALAFSVRGQG